MADGWIRTPEVIDVICELGFEPGDRLLLDLHTKTHVLDDGEVLVVPDACKHVGKPAAWDAGNKEPIVAIAMKIDARGNPHGLSGCVIRRDIVAWKRPTAG